MGVFLRTQLKKNGSLMQKLKWVFVVFNKVLDFLWFGLKGVEASVNGVLGGYGHVNDADVKGSEGFLQTLLAELFVDGGIDRHLVALGILFHCVIEY